MRLALRFHRYGWRRYGRRAAAAAGVLGALAGAHAGELIAPVAAEQPVAVWPDHEPREHDVVVRVLLVIGPQGQVESAELEDSFGPEFDLATLDVVKRWSFKPALHDGKPVAAKIRALVRFVAKSPTLPPGAAEAGNPVPGAAQADVRDVRPAAAKPAPAPADDSKTITVTVAGTRVPPPRSASEITQDKRVLKAAPHRTASDLLLTVPGIALTQHSGEGAAHQIYFRGFDAVHGQDLEIWAGGAPVNDVSNLHGQGYADLNFLPPEVVKRIRSAPGTYDPRQGDFAVAGSLWLDLGYDEPGVSGKVTLGQFGTRRYFVGYHPAGFSDATFAAFELYSTDGFGPSRAAHRTSAIAQTAVELGGMDLRVLASTYAATFASAGVLRLDDIESGKIDRFGSYDEHQGGDSARSQLVVELSHSDEDARFSVSPYVVLRSMRLRQNFTGYLVEPFNGTASEVAAWDEASKQGNSEQQTNDATTFGFNASYLRTLPIFTHDDSIEAGVSARYDVIDQTQNKLSVDTSQVTFKEVDAKVHATDVAGYLDLALNPLPRLVLRGGVRIDGLAYVTQDDGAQGNGARRAAQGAHLGGKATADFKILPALHALASYGDGFRSPQARSLQEGERAPFTTVQSYEIGLRYQTRELRSTASLFRTLLSDDLAFNQATARNERTPPTRRTGVSAEMLAEPLRWFDAAASVTYTRAEFTNTDGGYDAGDLMPYAPQLVVRTDLAFTPTLGHWLERPITSRFGVGTTTIALRPLPYGETGHDAFLVDAQASVRLKEVELGVQAFNLLNAQWYDGEYTYASNFQRNAAPSLVPARHVTVGPPRTVLGTLSFYL